MLSIPIGSNVLRICGCSLCLRIVVSFGVNIIEIRNIKTMQRSGNVFHRCSPRPIIISIVAFSTTHKRLSITIKRTFEFGTKLFVKLISQSLRHSVYSIAFELKGVSLIFFHLFHSTIYRDLFVSILAYIGYYKTFSTAPTDIGERTPTIFAKSKTCTIFLAILSRISADHT